MKLLPVESKKSDSKILVLPEAFGPVINVILSENSIDFEPKFRKSLREIFPIIVSQLYNDKVELPLMTKNPLISVIIPAYNEEAFIAKCLNSLLLQNLDRKFFEVIVIDNASTDETLKIVKKFPVKIIEEKNKSVILARQRGVDKARGKIIVSADADTAYPPEWLKNIKTDFDKNPNLIALVGWIYYANATPLFDMIIGLGQEMNLFFQKYTKRFPIAYAANFAFKKDSLKAIGGYPPHLVELGDQQYLLQKFLDIGPVIIDPKVKCFTSARKTGNVWKNIIVYNLWNRLLGYTVNRLTGKKIIGAAPAVRRG